MCNIYHFSRQNRRLEFSYCTILTIPQQYRLPSSQKVYRKAIIIIIMYNLLYVGMFKSSTSEFKAHGGVCIIYVLVYICVLF